ncbi:MAG: hypothetical protein R3E14_12725 [Erythrobacter sp.]
MSVLLTVLLPFGVPTIGDDEVVISRQVAEPEGPVLPAPMSRRAPNWTSFSGGIPEPVARQVRIEGRMILRISPQPGPVRQDMLADLQPRQSSSPPRLVERPLGECITARNIVGVADRGSRLVFYMRDRTMVSARLEKSCSPRDFYLGFYTERNDDGRLCVDRDRLMSRAGARCQVAEFNRLMLVQPRQ